MENLDKCCEKCYLIECCCEADRLQVIKDDDRARADGYIELDNGKWVKKEVLDTQQKLNAEYTALLSDWKKIDEFYKPNPEYPKCVLCKEHLSGSPYGNNPQPIRKKGKCCDRCNNDKVIPARMKLVPKLNGNPNPFGTIDEQMLCRKIQTFLPTQGSLDYPLIWEAFQADQLEDEIADVIKQFYKKTMERGAFPIIKDEGGITFTSLYSAIKDRKAVIRGFL